MVFMQSESWKSLVKYLWFFFRVYLPLTFMIVSSYLGDLFFFFVSTETRITSTWPYRGVQRGPRQVRSTRDTPPVGCFHMWFVANDMFHCFDLIFCYEFFPLWFLSIQSISALYYKRALELQRRINPLCFWYRRLFFCVNLILSYSTAYHFFAQFLFCWTPWIFPIFLSKRNINNANQQHNCADSTTGKTTTSSRRKWPTQQRPWN